MPNAGSLAVDTFLASASIAAMRTNIGLAALGNTESLGWADALLTRLGAGHIGNANRMTHSINAAASAPPVSVTGTWFTGGTTTTTKPQMLIEPAGATSNAWSTAGTGLGVNAPSGFTGNLLDLQVNGNSRLYFSGGALTAGSSTATGSVSVIQSAGTTIAQLTGTNGYLGLHMAAGGLISWGSGAGLNGTQVLFLLRDADNTLGQRNGTNAQGFNIYNTSSTNNTVYERGYIRWATNVFEIGSENTGVGTSVRDVWLRSANALTINPANGSGLTVRFGGSNSYQFNQSAFYPESLYSLGTTTRPWSNIFLRPSASLTPTANGDLVIEATNNTTLTLKLKGSDGTIRSVALTLAP